MAKKGVNKRTKKKSQPRKRRVATRPLQVANVSHGAMQVCSITNPFCPESKGARWPDGAVAKSVGWSYQNTRGMSTNTAEEAIMYFAGAYFYAVNTTTPATGTNTYATLTGFASSFPSNVSKYRVTSWGLRVKCIAPALTAQGMVRIRLFSPSTGVPMQTVSSTNQFADAMYDIPLARLMQKDLFIIPSPLGTVQPRLYRDWATDNAANTMAAYVNPGWQMVQIAVTGGPTSIPVIDVTQYYNYELVFEDGSANYAFAEPAQVNAPRIQEASTDVLSKVGNFLEGTAEKVDSIFQSKAFKYIGGALSMGLSAYTGSNAPMIAYGATQTRAIKDVN